MSGVLHEECGDAPSMPPLRAPVFQLARIPAARPLVANNTEHMFAMPTLGGAQKRRQRVLLHGNEGGVARQLSADCPNFR